MPRAIEDLDLRGYDVIVSSSHAVGKGIIPPSSAVHICYCHTPMRYAWEMEDQYLDDFSIPRFLRKTVKKKLKDLRRWDLATAKQKRERFLAVGRLVPYKKFDLLIELSNRLNLPLTLAGTGQDERRLKAM